MPQPVTLHFPPDGSGISVILKLAGETCNINCHYCYEKRKPYPGAGKLEPEVLRKFLRLCGTRPLHVELHGGEPLVVGRDRMAALFAELRGHPAPITMAIQTNGTLLTDTWINFLLDQWPSLDIGVSLDGPASINDAHRVDYRERGTTARTEDALRRLATYGRSIGVIAAVTRQSLGRETEIVDYFASLPGVRYVKFAPCLDFNVKTKTRSSLTLNVLAINGLNPTGTGAPGWATSPAEYCDFLITIFDIWREEAYRQYVVEPIYSLIRSLQGSPPSLCHFSTQKCAFVLTLYPDGRIGSCDELRMPDALLGHVTEYSSLDDVLSMNVNQNLRQDLQSLLVKCSGCAIQDTCRGGCLATRLQYVGTHLDDEYCRYRTRLVDHVRRAIGMSPLPSQMPWAPAGWEPAMA